MSDPLSYRVRGKIILFGEHAVVYGVPALAVPVPRHLTLSISEQDDGPLFEAPCWEVSLKIGHPEAATERLDLALQRAIELCPSEVGALRLLVDSDIPRSAGMGSSAALSVALVRGLAGFTGETLSIEEEIKRALEIEKVFHGKPSGVDHSAVTLDRPIVFIKDQPPQTQLPLAKPLNFVVGVVGNHGETAGRVMSLAERREALPQIHADLFEAIGQVANRALRALGQGDPRLLGSLMDLNQGLLNALGVSSAATEQAVFAARAAGALGAKLSGAGGGGAMLALCDGATAPVERALDELGWPSFVLRLVPDERGFASVPE